MARSRRQHERREMVRYARSASQQPRIGYRQVIASLVRKPGAFAGYLYRKELFPQSVFRHAIDRLVPLATILEFAGESQRATAAMTRGQA